jgi:hypothetical protein
VVLHIPGIIAIENVFGLKKFRQVMEMVYISAGSSLRKENRYAY